MCVCSQRRCKQPFSVLLHLILQFVYYIICIIFQPFVIISCVPLIKNIIIYMIDVKYAFQSSRLLNLMKFSEFIVYAHWSSRRKGKHSKLGRYIFKSLLTYLTLKQIIWNLIQLYCHCLLIITFSNMDHMLCVEVNKFAGSNFNLSNWTLHRGS